MEKYDYIEYVYRFKKKLIKIYFISYRSTCRTPMKPLVVSKTTCTITIAYAVYYTSKISYWNALYKVLNNWSIRKIHVTNSIRGSFLS